MTRVRVSLRRSPGSDPREVLVKLLEKWLALWNVTVRDSFAFPISNPLAKIKKVLGHGPIRNEKAQDIIFEFFC